MAETQPCCSWLRRSRRVTNVRLVRLFSGTSTSDWSDWNVGFIGVVLFVLFVAAFHSGRNVLKAVIRPEQRTSPAPPGDARQRRQQQNNRFVSNFLLNLVSKETTPRPDGSLTCTFSNCGRKHKKLQTPHIKALGPNWGLNPRPSCCDH